MNDKIALFIFDFDGTLVEKNSHNYIGRELAGYIQRNIQNRIFSSYNEHDKEIARLEQKFSIELMERFLDNENLGWKNEEQIVRLFKNIILSGHKIAIASFNAYPDAVKYALEQLLGKEIVENIYIKSGLPADTPEEIQLCNKVSYIKEVMSNTEITNKANVFFMDDDKKHTDAATDYKIKAVLVDEIGISYIHQAFNFLYDFNEKHEIYVDLKDPDTEPLFSDEENSYLTSEAIKAIPFEPLFGEYYDEYTAKSLSDGECTPWESQSDLLGNN